MWSRISTGPVAQLRPSEQIGYCESATAAAAISVPSSIVPVFSIVTLAMIGTSIAVLPLSASAAITALMTHLTCSRSWHVSMMNTSTPPASSPRAASRYDANIPSQSMFPSVMSLVPGPMLPATNRGLSLVWNLAHAARASSAASWLSANAWSASSNSASTCGIPPKVSVSTQSAPTARNDSWIDWIRSGRLRIRTSGQFSLPQ